MVGIPNRMIWSVTNFAIMPTYSYHLSDVRSTTLKSTETFVKVIVSTGKSTHHHHHRLYWMGLSPLNFLTLSDLDNKTDTGKSLRTNSWSNPLTFTIIWDKSTINARTSVTGHFIFDWTNLTWWRFKRSDWGKFAQILFKWSSFDSLIFLLF